MDSWEIAFFMMSFVVFFLMIMLSVLMSKMGKIINKRETKTDNQNSGNKIKPI